MKQGRNTTQDERIAIVKDCLASGKNYGKMALKYQISYQQVQTWTMRFEEFGEAWRLRTGGASARRIRHHAQS